MRSEQETIQRYFAPLAGAEGLHLADDAALLPPDPQHDLIVTSDLIAEGVHFMRGDPPGAIAAKALRVNLSDLYCKGAEPFAYLLDLGLGDDVDEDWIAAFAQGLSEDQDRYGIRLIGGDTNRNKGGTVVAIAAFGRVPEGKMVRRSGAIPGDIIVVSGNIGDAALGLEIRQGRFAGSAEAENYLLARLRYPEPPAAAASTIRAFATSAMDVSDGLVGDLAKLCLSSRVGAIVDAETVPLSPATRSAIAAESRLFNVAMTGGEDFEILATIPGRSLRQFLVESASAEVSFTPIGRIVAEVGLPLFLDGDRHPIDFDRVAFDHFAPKRRT
ncbi:MAG: thiamine-phosphate kinase [Alphaproteobacteria bacterium]